MQRPWIYQRKNRNGWYVGWYDNAGKRHSKKCPNKSVANRYARRVEYQMNEDIYPDPIATPWEQLVQEYLEYKQNVRSLADESLRSIAATLQRFKEIHGPVKSVKIDQRLIDKFVAKRLKTTSKATVNKDLRNLRAFIRWSIKNRFMGAPARKIDWEMQKEAKRPVKSLTPAQLSNLLIAARQYDRYGDAWYIRVLLAASSGLRKGDIERLQISDIDFELGTATTFSQKTGKGMPNRPLHPKALTALSKYVNGLPDGQKALFDDKFTSGKWKRIRNRAGLPSFKFHDLRKTFGSLVAQAGFSTSTVQTLLEHSTPRLTHDIYTDISPVLRQAVESVPLDEIIEP